MGNEKKTKLPEPYEYKLLKNQKALITGASSGIGKAIAYEMAKAGADVAVNYIKNSDPVNEIIKDIKAYEVNAVAVKADVSSEYQVKRMFQKVSDIFGGIDILVSNAGMQMNSPFEDMTLDKWQKVIDVNLTGGFLCAREAVKEFRKKGIIPEVSCSAGKIIFISSVHETIPWSSHSNYAASKGGLKMLMKTIAQETAASKIRVNSIAPGAVKTGINRRVWSNSQKRKKMLELIPSKRIGDPKDIGTAAVWLASDMSDYINGTTIYIDGGMTLYPGFAESG